jgi:hypothetical protein
MFTTKFPLELTIDGTITNGVLTLLNAKTWLRYVRLPGYPIAVPKFVIDPNNPAVAPCATHGPFAIADVFPSSNAPASRIFQLSFNGSQVTNPDDPIAIALLDHENVDLDLYMGTLVVPHMPSLEIIASIHLRLKLKLC